MGAHLPKPITTKTSLDEEHDSLSFGVSGMQGWRIRMEDAHCSLVDIDSKNTSLFGVFDGHGGAEVAIYCAQNLVRVLKESEEFSQGDISNALTRAFMLIDESITTDEVKAELRVIAGIPQDDCCSDDDEDINCIENEAKLLSEEANMPIEELLKRIKESAQQVFDERKEEDEDEDEEDEKEEKENVVVNGHGKENGDKAPTTNGTSVDAPAASSSKGGRKRKAPPVKRNPFDSESSALGAEEEAGCSSTKEEAAPSSENGEVGSSKEEPGSSTEAPKEEATASATPSLDAALAALSKAGSSSVDTEADEEGEASSSKQDGAGEGSTTDLLNGDGSSDDDDEDDDSSDSDCDLNGDDDDDDDDDDVDGDGDIEFADADGMALNDPYCDEVGSDSGTTANVACIFNNRLYVANAGDSRCVLCRNGQALEMSYDHKPEEEVERTRIEKAGARILADGRVNGGLNLSRAIGDHTYKKNKDIPLQDQAITALPDIKEEPLTKEDSFMVLACDGIWNVMESQEVVDFIKERIDSTDEKTNEKIKLSVICEELFDRCIAPDTNNDGTGCDNMTALIVRFRHDAVTVTSSVADVGQKRRAVEDDDDDEPELTKRQKIAE